MESHNKTSTDDRKELAEDDHASESLLDHTPISTTTPEGEPAADCLVPVEEPSTDERETWGKKIDFLLSVIGFAVDLANVWRFPYLCYKNGGGAFLVPYVVMLVFGGIPLFYMELALGQFHRKGAISSWGALCPIFKGIGWAVVLIAFYTDFFYNVIISWALYYFFASFTGSLPWTECGEWATESCFSGHMHGEKFPVCDYKERIPICEDYKIYTDCQAVNSTCSVTPNFTYPSIDRSQAMFSSFKPMVDSLFNSSYVSYDNVSDTVSLSDPLMKEYCSWVPTSTSPSAEYFQRGVLGLHEVQGIEDIGTLRWQNVLCLLAIYIICYFSLWKGISTSGKVVWFTALFPYVVLFILLIRGVTLPGASMGIKEYITPKFDKITHASVWVDAATQVFFSLGPGFGVLLAFASYNKFNNNVYRDAIATSLINCGTSFLAGFVVFSILGYLATKTCKDFYTVAQEGPGLVFEVYPEAIATLPGSTFWSLIFFLMLLTLGLDSSFGGSEAIITGVTDEFPVLKKRRELFVAVLFTIYFLVGLASCTYGGFYVVRIFEVFAAGYSILFAVFCESLVVSWIYGVWRFSYDIKLMIGQPPGIFWVSCWALVAPIFLGSIMVYGMSHYVPLSYLQYDYPLWSNVFGWIMAGSSMACIPIGAVVMTVKILGQDGGSFSDLFNGWWSKPDSYFSIILDDYTSYFTCKNREQTTTNGGHLNGRENGKLHEQESVEPSEETCLNSPNATQDV